MKKHLLLLMISWMISLISFSQGSEWRACRISGGIGFASPVKNVKSVGTDFWMQLDYRFLARISIATEFENMSYIQPGYFETLPVSPNEIKVYNNNFSLLLKYHLPAIRKIAISFATGATFSIRQDDYYIYINDGTTINWFPNVTSFSDYRLPLLIEIEYPVTKTLNVGIRSKYNLHLHNGNTYSIAGGLSLKL